MDCSQTELENSSKRNDALYHLALINKYVKVQLIKNTMFMGFVSCIDPVTHSVILSIPKEDKYQTVIIPGHAVLNISEEIQSKDIKPPVQNQIITSEENVVERKTRLLAWFKFNRLPVMESGDEIVFGNVSILPPYSSSDLFTDNPIVSLQVKKIIENMPQDFHV